MADPRFFERAGPFTLAELSAMCGAEIARGEGGSSFDDVAPLQTAGASEISFLENKLYVGALSESHAGAYLPGANV